MKRPELTTEEAEQCLAAASQAGTLEATIPQTASPGAAFALLCHEGVVYFARHSPVAHEPCSALVKLVQGVYETLPDSALHLLRHRIFVTSTIAEMDWGMLKVAARKASQPLEPRDHGLMLSVELRELSGLATSSTDLQDEGADDFPLSLWSGGEAPQSDEDFLALAAQLAATVAREPGAKLISQDRAIAALLVAPDGTLLSWGLNRITRNRTLHAELNAAQRYWRRHRRALPAGTRVYSTLKACRMCAGMIWQLAAEPRSLHVRYTTFDPGPNARETVFNQKGLAIERQVP